MINKILLSLLVVLISISIAGGIDVVDRDRDIDFGVFIQTPIQTGGSVAPGTTTDTNATTECTGAEVLLGNSSCQSTAPFLAAAGTDTDTNASTTCTGGEVLLGNTSCQNIVDFLTGGADTQKTTDFFYVYNDSDTIYFNETQLNETIENRIASVTYRPVSMNVTGGTLDVGNFTDLWYTKDGFNVNISEDSGAPPVLEVIINYSGVIDFNTVILRELYKGGAGHEIVIGLYDFDGGVYEEEYGDITDMDDYAFSIFNVLDSDDHIQNGVVSLRLRHEQNGISNHDLSIDYAVLVDGFSTITTTDHDSLSGRDGTENHPWAMDAAATRNFTGNLFMDTGGYNFTANWLFGFLNWSYLQNIPSYVKDWSLHFTHLSNFTDDILWTSDFNDTFDERDTDTISNETDLINSVNTTANIESLNFVQGSHLVDIFINDSELPLANLTLPYCGNITGAVSDLCTIVDTDTTYFPIDQDVNITSNVTFNNITMGGGSISTNGSCLFMKWGTSEIGVCL